MRFCRLDNILLKMHIKIIENKQSNARLSFIHHIWILAAAATIYEKKQINDET